MEAVTIQEAKEKWCCMGMAQIEVMYCAADKCMAWRWFDDKEYLGERRGYCGLAGKITA